MLLSLLIVFMFTFSFNLILVSFNLMTFLVVNFIFFFGNVLSWDWHFLLYCCFEWDLCCYISWGGLLRWWLLRRWILLLLLKWRELILINFILVLLIFFRFIIISFLFNLDKFLSWLIFINFIFFILVILFLDIFLTILIVFFITFHISTNLNEFDFTFMDSCIDIVDLDFTRNSVTFYSSTRTLSSLIAYIDALMYNSLLFLLFRLWPIIIFGFITLFIWLVLFLHGYTLIIRLLSLKLTKEYLNS